MQLEAPPPILCVGGGKKSRGAQSVNLWQAFFQRQAVHHMSRFSIPYTLRHFFPSPRTFRLQRTDGTTVKRNDVSLAWSGAEPLPERCRCSGRRRERRDGLGTLLGEALALTGRHLER